MENLNISQYINKVTGDSISAEEWNGVFSAIQLKVNELVEAYNEDAPVVPTVSSLYVNGVLHEETGDLVLPAQQSYTLTGTYYGQIIINATTQKPQDDTFVRFNDVIIISDENYGIKYMTPAENTGYKDLVITLEKDSENFVICNKVVAPAEDQPGAIYSMNNLRVQGVGYLALYNKGGHGIRGTETLVAGPHCYFDVSHDGVHGKKVAIDDGTFYLSKCVDGFGTGTNGHIEFYNGNVYTKTAQSVSGQIIDSKQRGLTCVEIPGAQDANVVGIGTYIGTTDHFSAKGYESKEDLELGVNGVDLAYHKNTIVAAANKSVSYNTIETVSQDVETYEGSFVWKFDVIHGDVNDYVVDFDSSAVVEEQLFTVYQKVVMGSTEYFNTYANVSDVSQYIVVSTDTDPEQVITECWISLPDGSASLDTFTLKQELVTYSDYLGYISISGNTGGSDLLIPEDFSITKDGASSSDVDVYLSGAQLGDIYFEPGKDRIKVKANKDSVNALYSIKSENNVSVEVSNGAHLYICSNDIDGIDGGDVKITDTKGSLIITGCGERGIKGNAVVIGPDAEISKSVIVSYITDESDPDYKDLRGVVVVKGNHTQHQKSLIDATSETTSKETGYADIYGRQGKKVTKGAFGTTDKELKGVLITDSLYCTISSDLGNAKNLYVKDAKVGTQQQAGTVSNSPGLTEEEYIVVPYNEQPIQQ